MENTEEYDKLMEKKRMGKKLTTKDKNKLVRQEKDMKKKYMEEKLEEARM